MSRPMGLIELLTRVGEDNVRVQPMLDSVTNIRLTKRDRDSVVTFVTGSHLLNPNDLLAEKVRHIPLILWISSELADKARAEHDVPVVHPDDATPERLANWQGGL